MIEFIIKYWIEILFGLVLSIITLFAKKILSYKRIIENSNYGLVMLLKSNILNEYLRLKENEQISIFEKENINDMYKAYTLLGGNSFIKDIIEKINQYKLID